MFELIVGFVVGSVTVGLLSRRTLHVAGAAVLAAQKSICAAADAVEAAREVVANAEADVRRVGALALAAEEDAKQSRFAAELLTYAYDNLQAKQGEPK